MLLHHGARPCHESGRTAFRQARGLSSSTGLTDRMATRMTSAGASSARSVAARRTSSRTASAASSFSRRHARPDTDERRLVRGPAHLGRDARTLHGAHRDEELPALILGRVPGAGHRDRRLDEPGLRLRTHGQHHLGGGRAAGRTSDSSDGRMRTRTAFMLARSRGLAVEAAPVGSRRMSMGSTRPSRDRPPGSCCSIRRTGSCCSST